MDDGYSWAEPYHEVHKICTLFNITEVKSPLRFRYTGLEPCIQVGPQCGLVALAMAAKNSSKETVDGLMSTAKTLGYSYNGEMFNAHDMCSLAKTCMKDKKIDLYEGYLYNDFIINFLFNDGLILVPYDCGPDHSPCLKCGRKAHWGVICGIIETHDIFIMVRHGKTKNVAIWSLHELADSNAQLEEFCPDDKLRDLQYKLPVTGIGGEFGLKSKSVLIYN